MRTSLRFAYLLTGILFIAQVASAQVATGFPPFGSFSGGPFDTINNANLNIHFEIPIVSKAGRGLPFNAVLTYDSSIWQDSLGSWVRDQQWAGEFAARRSRDSLDTRLRQRPVARGFRHPKAILTPILCTTTPMGAHTRFLVFSSTTVRSVPVDSMLLAPPQRPMDRRFT
jgi:hypothetical protein